MLAERFPRLTAALRRRRLALVAAGGAALVIVGAGTTAAVATTPAAVPTASASCAPGAGALVHALRGDGALRADLKHLAKESKSGKAADRGEIRKKALAGDYGREIGRVARIVAGEDAPKGALPAALPKALTTDLVAFRHAAKHSDARRTQAAAIWRKALDGSYGAEVKTAATTAKARLDQRCAARATRSGG